MKHKLTGAVNLRNNHEQLCRIKYIEYMYTYLHTFR